DIQKGRVGITLDCSYLQPYRGSQNQDDVQAVKYGYDFMFGWFMEPITSGTWPESMQTFAQSATLDYPDGRVLPKFSSDQVTKLIGSYDFLGINYYTASYVRKPTCSDEISLGYLADSHYVESDEKKSSTNGQL
nr:furcatin hydrolase [Tanacetum cinerariifolium]